MKISCILPATIALIILSGCATVTKEMAATGGSKADGTIELSYEHSELESVTVDEKKAIETAKSRCKSWGYKNAEKFGGSKTTCIMRGGFSGCARSITTTQYQCTD